MKLYYYEHCPFSARVRMMLNLKGVDAEREVILEDDEQTIATLVGKHTIPVLVTDEGEPLADSMTIVGYLNLLNGSPLLDEHSTQGIDEWIENVVPAMQYLGYPRWFNIGLKELATPSAKARFRDKKSETIGDFDEALANSRPTITEVEHRLKELQTIVKLDAQHNPVTIDDIKVFPMLRGFTVVKDLEWPQPLRRYVEQMAARSDVDTFFDRSS